MQLSESEWIIRQRGTNEVHALKKDPKSLVAMETKYQRIEIVRTLSFGKALLLDGVYQSSEYDQLLKHEVLVHPAMALKQNEELNVLVIGGGEGCVVREVLRHSNVSSVTMLELDEKVPALCSEHLGWDAGALDDPRTRLIFGDASKNLPALPASEKFDLVFVDSTQPADGSLAGPLVSTTFIEELHRRLRPNGLLAGYGINAAPIGSSLRRKIRNRVSRIFGGSTIEYVTPCPFYSASFAFQLSSIQFVEELQGEVLKQFGDLDIAGERALDLVSLKSYLAIPWGYR